MQLASHWSLGICIYFKKTLHDSSLVRGVSIRRLGRGGEVGAVSRTEPEELVSRPGSLRTGVH